ncbi:MAG TPA: MarR family transcriptional regulator [Steroidobacteraceae bacterium]
MYKRPVGTIYLLKRAELAVRSCMDVALAEFDLTPAQFLMLYRLRDHAELSGAALARDIGVRPQSIIGLIRPLQNKGILEREPSPAHQRVLHMRLTSAGKKLLADAVRVAGRIEAELLADLDDKQVAALQEVLAALWRSAEGNALHPGSIRAKAQELMRAHMAVSHRRGPRAAPQRTRTAAVRPRR